MIQSLVAERQGIAAECQEKQLHSRIEEMGLQTAAVAEAGQLFFKLEKSVVHDVIRLLLLRAGDFHNLLNHVVEQLALLGVSGFIVDLFSDSPADNQTTVFQRAQVMGHGRA